MLSLSVYCPDTKSCLALLEGLNDSGLKARASDEDWFVIEGDNYKINQLFIILAFNDYIEEVKFN